MARKLVNFGLVWVLALGCWCGVLAAAACPHLGCEAAAPESAAAQAEHPPGEGHGPAGSEDHSAHGAAHRSRAEETAAAQPSRPVSAERTGGTSGAHGSYCSHCMDSPDTAPSPKSERLPGPVNKGLEDAAPHAGLQAPAPHAAHVREVIPAQHAPPGSPDRHLLLGVFRI